MGDFVGRERRGRQIYEMIGEFLFRHGLEPSPGNYLLVHQVVTGSNPETAAAINQATADGIRLSQTEADRIMRETGAAPVVSAADRARVEGAAAEMRRQMDAFAVLVSGAHQATREYERDLETSAHRLEEGAQSLSDLLRITAAMVDRTRAAERQLEAATDEAQTLRQKLANAHEEARVDVLTGLPNRRALEEHFRDTMARHDSACVVVCDLDRFKSINDLHGHAVGDRVLAAVGGALQEAFDGYFVARYGGEEFVVVLPDVGISDARTLTEAALKQIENRRFRVRETDRPLSPITVSAGVACCSDGEFQSTIQRADALLYKAKQSGRNRTIAETVEA